VEANRSIFLPLFEPSIFGTIMVGFRHVFKMHCRKKIAKSLDHFSLARQKYG
jgi:hypothetical protein